MRQGPQACQEQAEEAIKISVELRGALPRSSQAIHKVGPKCGWALWPAPCVLRLGEVVAAAC